MALILPPLCFLYKYLKSQPFTKPFSSPGVCDCDDDFLGADCSHPKANPPVVDPAPVGQCDTVGNRCVQIKITGNFVDIPDIRCRLILLEVRVVIYYTSRSQRIYLQHCLALRRTGE